MQGSGQELRRPQLEELRQFYTELMDLMMANKILHSFSFPQFRFVLEKMTLRSGEAEVTPVECVKDGRKSVEGGCVSAPGELKFGQ